MYYNGVADYWKHFNSDAQDGQTGLDWHMGGVGYGLQPGEDTPLYNYSVPCLLLSYFFFCSLLFTSSKNFLLDGVALVCVSFLGFVLCSVPSFAGPVLMRADGRCRRRLH